MSVTSDEQIHLEYYHAMRRWKQGHQSFHLQLVAINTVIGDCILALKQGDEPKLAHLIRTLAILYDTATVSMKYAADLPQQSYESIVRPSMMPPYLSPGFSGILNIEHATMLKELKHLGRCLKDNLGPVIEEWPLELFVAWMTLDQAKARNRDNHALVCQKFVDGGVSLLNEFYAKKKRINNEIKSREETKKG